jgi:glycosyltransferase involved in cell wall biosynthesis
MSDLDELRRLVADDRRPDPVLAEDWLDAKSFSDSDLDAFRGIRRRLLARLPDNAALALGAWWKRDEFDVAVTWGERLAYPLALLMTLTPRRRTRHIGILFWPLNVTSPSRLKRTLKRIGPPLLVRCGIDRLCVPAPLQQRLVLERWGIPAGRLVSAQWPVDTNFWSPIDAPGETICSVGREMRDYETLVAALAPLAMPCHIAAGTALNNSAYGTDDPRASKAGGAPLRDGITVGYKTIDELRDLYAHSRLVVVPIMPSENDNGATAILEAMSMGRPVIATDTAGKLDLLRDGVNCVLVPPRDPDAMRAAIESLWEDTERRERIGREARESVLAGHGIRQWIDAIRSAADELARAGTAAAAA